MATSQYTIGDAPPPAQPAAPQYTIGDAPTMNTPPRPMPAHDALAGSLAPQGGEGAYNMHDTAGIVRPIGYHQVHQALDQGFRFADKPTLEKYARDHAADPVDESRVDKWIDQHPILSVPLQGVIGAGTGALKTLTAFDAVPKTRLGTEVQLAAATPTKGVAEGAGEAGEGLGEWFTGEQLLGLLGRAGQAVKISEKLKDVATLSNLAEKYPMVAKLIKIGESVSKSGTARNAAKSAALGGAQTFVKTEGDVPATLEAGGVNAILGPLLDVGAGGIKGGVAMAKGPAQTAEAEAAAAAARTAESRATYAQTAREAAQPSLEQTNAARNVPTQETMMNQPGGQPAVPSGTRVATATGKPAPPQINVPQVLDQIHDFTGAADRLTQINDEAYNQFDTATNGRFRQLNGEVMAAQNAARSGDAEAAAVYKQKLGDMDKLIDQTAEMTPEMKDAAKAGFRQSYLLRDFGNLWDKNFNGVPGASQASQVQRGINGTGLMRDLQRAVKSYGRSTVEQTLGPGRLETLEQIADANVTAAKRKTFNGGVKDVAKSMFVNHAIPATLAGYAFEAGGSSFFKGVMTAEALNAATRIVMNSMKTNPKIAQNFLFALKSGATSERYGPFIATMIQQQINEGARRQEQRELEDKQQ